MLRFVLVLVVAVMAAGCSAAPEDTPTATVPATPFSPTPDSPGPSATAGPDPGPTETATAGPRCEPAPFDVGEEAEQLPAGSVPDTLPDDFPLSGPAVQWGEREIVGEEGVADQVHLLGLHQGGGDIDALLEEIVADLETAGYEIAFAGPHDYGTGAEDRVVDAHRDEEVTASVHLQQYSGQDVGINYNVWVC